MKQKKKKQCLFLEMSNRITDQDGDVVSVKEARKIYESGKLDDWNMAFDRLARHFDFDLEATRAYYEKANAEHAKRTSPLQTKPADLLTHCIGHIEGMTPEQLNAEMDAHVSDLRRSWRDALVEADPQNLPDAEVVIGK